MWNYFGAVIALKDFTCGPENLSTAQTTVKAHML